MKKHLDRLMLFTSLTISCAVLCACGLRELASNNDLATNGKSKQIEKILTPSGVSYVPVNPKFFVVGTFVPPAHLMGTFKARGINTAVEVPEGNNLDEWTSAAVANQMYMIRRPRSNPALDANQAYLLAWALPDEPSNVAPGSPGVDYQYVNMTPSELDQMAASWRAALPPDKEIPIYLNLTGSHITDQFINATIMKDYVDSPSVDLIAHDTYTINSGMPMIYSQDGYVTTRQGHAIDRLDGWSGGKPQYSYIECSDYDANGSLPDAGQMRAEIWSSIIHGATGIIYFPVVLSPWSWDGTPPALVSEMTVQHQKIREIEPIIMDLSTGRSRGTLYKMAQQGAAPGPVQLPYPFEARTYPTPQGTFYVILNLSPNGSASLNYAPFGMFGVSFARYEVKMGYLSNTAPSPTPTPMPTPSPAPSPDPTPGPSPSPSATPLPTPSPLPASPQSLFTSQVPQRTGLRDGVNYELGMRFKVSIPGRLQAIRFYKSPGESGKHVGKIYSASGGLLAQVTFSGESASGWQKQILSAPLRIAANTTYVVSVNTGRKYYVATNWGLSSIIANGGISSLGHPNGVYGPVGRLPTNSYQDSNYFRDIEFVPDAIATPSPTPVATPSPTPPATPSPSPTPLPSATPTPTPSATPMPVPAPTGLRGWQLNETNTGLAGAGIDRNSLPIYSGPMKPAAGTVIRGQKITTNLILSNGNITIEKCWIQPTTSLGVGSVIFTYDPSFGTQAPGPVSIVDSDIDGSRVTDPKIYLDCAVRGAANVQRNNIFGMGGGICIFDSPAMTNILVEGNYVHNLRGGLVPGMEPPQSHNESATIRSFEGNSLIFRNNRLVSKTGSDSGALFIQAWAGFINHVLVEGNLLETYGWAIPLEANSSGYGTDMRSRNNRFVKIGYGPAYVTGGPGWAEWTENYYDDPAQVDHKGGAISAP